MSGKLAAKDRFGLRHRLLDERVADAIAFRLAAGFADDVGDDVAGAKVVDDRGPFVLGCRKEMLRQEGGDQIAAEHAPVLIEKDASIGIAIAAGAKVRLGLAHVRLW